MREAVIASSVRTPVGKAFKGALRSTRPDDLAAVAIQEAIRRVPGLDPNEIEDIILGCAMPEAEAGMNVARNAALRAGLPVEISAITINRFCSSGLQSIAMAAERIMAGHGDVILAGGTESMTMIPMGGNKVSPNPWLMDNNPDAYLSMGLTAENVARKYGVTREQADEFSLASHKKALAAIGMSGERARTLGVKPMARFLGFATAGVPPEVMGIGPAFAIPKALKLTGLTLDQIDVIELNEAFAVQALAVIKTLGIDPARVNPNGGAIALGHPLGCTGAKLTASILRELARRNARYGMVTMCIGGGMGAAGIFERM